MSRWKWLEADQSYQVSTATTEKESERLVAIHNGALVPTAFPGVSRAFGFRGDCCRRRRFHPFRYLPHAQQKVIWRGPQAFDPAGSPLKLGNMLARPFREIMEHLPHSIVILCNINFNGSGKLQLWFGSR